MKNIFLDVESCGFHGLPVLLQYATNDQETQLYCPWKEPVQKTLDLIEYFCENCVIAFNSAFDWFQICKLGTTFLLLKDSQGKDAIPEDHIDLLGELEKEARDGPCIKPKSTFDIMLHARKGPYQSTMDRNDIKIKKVPWVLAQPLADELNKRVRLNALRIRRFEYQVEL